MIAPHPTLFRLLTPPLSVRVVTTPHGSEYERERIRAEEAIVWVPGFEPESVRYVREMLADCEPRRRGRPRKWSGRIVGWSDLPRTYRRKAGHFCRRIFWLADHDPYVGGGAPVEAVDPRLLVPGEPGVLTERAWGRPVKVEAEA